MIVIVKERKKSWESLIIDNQIHNFPFYFVVLYIFGVIIFGTLSLLYNKFFHPRKNIFFEDEKQNRDDDSNTGSRENRYHKDDDEDDRNEIHSCGNLSSPEAGVLQERTTL